MIGLLRLDRMLWRSVARLLLLVWAVLLAFDYVGALVNELEDLGTGRYGVADFVLVMLLQFPRRAYVVFPMAAVIAFVLALGGHAVRSELVALRALGLSPWRIGASGMLVLLGISLPLAFAGETLAPWAETQGQAIKLQAMHEQVALAGRGTLWAREGREYFHARGGVSRDEGEIFTRPQEASLKIAIAAEIPSDSC